MRLLTEDPQKIWDITVNYFRHAKSQCMFDNGFGCAYENRKGQRCVVGNLLVAETADDEQQLRTFVGSYETFFIALGLEVPGNVAEMLHTFQTIHDSSTYWKGDGLNGIGWNRLRIAGDVWGFEVPE